MAENAAFHKHTFVGYRSARWLGRKQKYSIKLQAFSRKHAEKQRLENERRRQAEEKKRTEQVWSFIKKFRKQK